MKNLSHHARVASVKCENDDDIKCVIIEGSGEKAFCAGGDVVSLRKQVLDDGGPPTELSEKFFYDEYLLNYKINNFKKPYIALIDGVTMGGGVGVSTRRSSGCRAPSQKVTFC